MATHESSLQRLTAAHLITLEVLYRMPDRPSLIAPPFVWQVLDTVPHLPRVMRFLRFWEAHIDAELFEVTIAGSPLIHTRELRTTQTLIRLQ